MRNARQYCRHSAQDDKRNTKPDGILMQTNRFGSYGSLPESPEEPNHAKTKGGKRQCGPDPGQCGPIECELSPELCHCCAVIWRTCGCGSRCILSHKTSLVVLQHFGDRLRCRIFAIGLPESPGIRQISASRFTLPLRRPPSPCPCGPRARGRCGPSRSGRHRPSKRPLSPGRRRRSCPCTR